VREARSEARRDGRCRYGRRGLSRRRVTEATNSAGGAGFARTAASGKWVCMDGGRVCPV